MIETGNKVETINGIGIVDEVRKTETGELTYLVRTLGTYCLGQGYSDIYAPDELLMIEED